MLDKKSTIPAALKDVIIVAVGVAIVLIGLLIAFDWNNPFYVVASGSMEPTLSVDDVLIVKDGNSFESLKVGDIIVFNKPDGRDRVIVHRIVDISDSGDTRTIRTKGDANPSSIPGTDYPIRDDDYIGKVIYIIPGIGIVSRVISPPVNYIIIAVILGVLFFTRMNKKEKGQGSPLPGSSGSPPT